METICILSRKAPYGKVTASEAIRHAMGGAVEELSVRLVLVDEGVNAARTSQDTSDSGYESMGTAIEDCLDMDVEVYADTASLVREGMDEGSLIDGVRAVEPMRVAELIRTSDQTLVF